MMYVGLFVNGGALVEGEPWSGEDGHVEGFGPASRLNVDDSIMTGNMVVRRMGLRFAFFDARDRIRRLKTTGKAQNMVMVKPEIVEVGEYQPTATDESDEQK
jgi:hypothetical protein